LMPCPAKHLLSGVDSITPGKTLPNQEEFDNDE
jgi:hypothetical protein